MKKRTKTIFKSLFIIIGLFVAIVLIINTSPFDEELNPRIVELLKDKPMPAIEGNAYFAIMGMHSAESENMNQVGLNLITRHIETRSKENAQLTPSDYEEITKIKNDVDQQWKSNIDSCDSREDSDCLTNTANLLTEEYLQNIQLQMMLKRYEQIINMKKFDNYVNFTFSTPLPQYGSMLKLSQIKLASNYRPEFRHDFLPSLVKDFKFWKLHLTDGLYLIDKMVAYAGLRKNMHYLSEYLRNNELSYQQLGLVKSLLIQLTSSEISLSECFIFETRAFISSMYSSNFNNHFDIESLLFQPQATSNLHYTQVAENFYMDANLSLKDIIQKRQTKNTNYNTSLGLNPKNLYNLMGKILVSYSGAAYDDYIVRGYDLNNIIKMVNIQFQIKQDEGNNIKSILNKKENLNPYNSQPFDFNSETNEMSFECLGFQPNCKIYI